jgi:hypothetical protein
MVAVRFVVMLAIAALYGVLIGVLMDPGLDRSIIGIVGGGAIGMGMAPWVFDW